MSCQRVQAKIVKLKEKVAAEVNQHVFVEHTAEGCDICLDKVVTETTVQQVVTETPVQQVVTETTVQQKTQVIAEETLDHPIDKPSPFKYSVEPVPPPPPADQQNLKYKNLFPETSPLRVTKTPLRRDRGAPKDIVIGTDPRSIASSQFIDSDLAGKYKCSICSVGNVSRIPLAPLTTKFCHHFYCPLCIQNWRSSEFVNSSSCPVLSCRKPFNDADLHSSSGLVQEIHQGLSVNCLFLKNGCNSIVQVGSYVEHLQTCKFSRNRGHPQKKPISLISGSDGRKRRLDPLRQNFFDSCAQNMEDPGDALCGLLYSFLSGSRRIQDQVRTIWDTLTGQDNLENDVTDEIEEQLKFGRMGLLYKGELLLSANDYKNAIRFQKHFFGSKLPSYELVQTALSMSLPANSNYTVESEKNLDEILTCFEDPQKILSNKPSETFEIKAERTRSVFHHSTSNHDSMDPCSIQLNFLDSSYSMIMVTGRVL